jgi:hypothetical protein
VRIPQLLSSLHLESFPGSHNTGSELAHGPDCNRGPRLGSKHITTIVASHPTLCQRACTYELPCPHHQSPHSQPRFHSSTQHTPLASEPKSQDNPVIMGNHLKRLLHVLDGGWHSRNRFPAPPPHHTVTLSQVKVFLENREWQVIRLAPMIGPPVLKPKLILLSRKQNVSLHY